MDLMPEEVLKPPRTRTVPSEPVAGTGPKFVSERDGAHAQVTAVRATLNSESVAAMPLK